MLKKIVLFTFSGLLIANLFAADKETIKTQIDVKTKVPQGVVIKQNKVTIKKGYRVERVSSSRANVIGRIRGGGTGITGSFDCTCNGTSGGCDVTTTPTSVSCSKSTCSSSCYMIVTIPGSAGNVMH